MKSDEHADGGGGGVVFALRCTIWYFGFMNSMKDMSDSFCVKTFCSEVSDQL